MSTFNGKWILLAGAVAVPVLAVGAGAWLLSEMEKVTRMAAVSDLKQIGNAISFFRGRTGACPEGDVMQALVDGGALEELPVDPWSGSYVAEREGDVIIVRALGEDRLPGGEGRDADIERRVDCAAPPP